jgi:hypothetical protein
MRLSKYDPELPGVTAQTEKNLENLISQTPTGRALSPLLVLSDAPNNEADSSCYLRQ